MINQIELQNFQAHEKSVLNFSEGINVIIGKSDSGKSSIMRALYYAVNNKPASNNYASHWIRNDKGNLSGELQIKITKNSETLTRFRNQSENGYRFKNQDFTAIGRDVPEEVQNYFNLTGVNLQRQLDSHFLLCETAGSVAKFFNELVNLDDIDLYLSAIDKKKRESNKDFKTTESNITQLQTDLKKYEWLPGAQKLVTEYQIIFKDFEQLQNNIKELQYLNNLIIEYKQALIKFKNLNTVIETIMQYENVLEDYTDIHLKYTDLSKINMSLRRYECELGYYPNFKQLENIFTDYENIQEEFTSCDAMYRDLQILINMIEIQQGLKFIDTDQAENFIQKINVYIEKIKNIRPEKLYNIIEDITELQTAQKNINKILIQLEKQLPDICPLCGNELRS